MSEIHIYNDNCIDVFNTIGDESVDLIVTDPPYPVTSRGSTGNADSNGPIHGDRWLWRSL